MCGITAFIGNGNAYNYLMFALKMLQNRGYDSAGLCVLNDDNEFIMKKYASTLNEKAVNKLEKLGDVFNNAQTGIGHSRWATSGCVSDENSHPHIDYKNRIALVHNGIIENYITLKKELIEKYNISFKSQTDSEVIVQLISIYYDQVNDLQKAIDMTLNRLEGTWGLVIMCKNEPKKLYCARHGSPLLIGFCDNYMIVSSEQSGFCKFVNNYICLNNNDLVVLEKNCNRIDFQNIHEYELREITIKIYDTTPDPYPHWTIKEINEQYDASMRAMGMGGRIVSNHKVRLGGLNEYNDSLKYIDHLILLGCGTSYHSGMHCLNILKQISGFDTVQVFDGAEFTKYDIPKSGKTALLMLSQSGETKDLHRCVDIGKDNGLFMIGVINVVDSLIAREVNCGVYLNAGREVAVASTKAFTSQVIVLHLIAIWFSQIRQIHEVKRSKIIKGLRRLPLDIKNTIMEIKNKCKNVANYLLNKNSVFVLGKGVCESVAKEGALKIKEIGYIHAEGYSSSSLKHGPYSLIDPGTPIIILSPDDKHFVRNNIIIEETTSRGAYVIGISDKKLNNDCDITIQIPHNEIFSGLLSVIPLQLVAYYLAVLKDHSPDFPKNLSKTISVL